jgi:hypothetical protein
MADQEQPSYGLTPKGDSSLLRSLLAELGNLKERLNYLHKIYNNALKVRNSTTENPDLTLESRSPIGKNPVRGAWLTRWEASLSWFIRFLLKIRAFWAHLPTHVQTLSPHAARPYS